MDRIGFVGVGVMGHGMAACLLAAGFQVTVIAHRKRHRVDDLVAKGAVEVGDYQALANASDTVILCVSDSTVVQCVIDALKPVLRAGMTVIDTGTSNPVATRAVDLELSELSVAFVEAPVTGGVQQSAAGELGALVGCDALIFERVNPLLKVFCKTVHHFGPAGNGNTAKLLNNFMVFGIAALVTEAFTKAEQAGIDWRKLYDVVICGSADSGVLRRIIGNAINDDFKGYVFDLRGSLKDVDYFCELAQSMGGESPLATAVHGVYAEAVANGHGERLLSELLAPDLRRRL